MAKFIPSQKTANDFNNDTKYVSYDPNVGTTGDIIQSETVNNLIESQLWTQALATNQPNTSEANNVGTPEVSIVTTIDGTPQFKFSNLKGQQGEKGEKGDTGSYAEVDTVLSSTSTNPVQNKVITNALNAFVTTDTEQEITGAKTFDIQPNGSGNAPFTVRRNDSYVFEIAHTDSVARIVVDGGEDGDVAMYFQDDCGLQGEIITSNGAGATPTWRSLKDFRYGTCGTASSTSAKTATIPIFPSTLTAGIGITVKFTNGNTTTSPTLNVNGTGAQPIKADGDTTYVKWLAGAVMDFVYDGTYWVCTAGYQLAGMRVGAVYLSNNSTSPATLYGGSWAAITSGYYLKAITSGTPAYGSAGLPNITATLKDNFVGANASSVYDKGALSGMTYDPQNWNATWNANGEAMFSQFNFDASNSNSIYGSSTTVTPLNRGAYMWYRTA